VNAAVGDRFETLSDLRSEEVYDVLKPLLALLPNGRYSLHVYNPADLFWHGTYPGGESGSSLLIHLVFPNIVDPERADEIKNGLESLGHTEPEIVVRSMTGQTATDLHDSFDEGDYYHYDDFESLVGTRPENPGDTANVAAWEKRIRRGERPVVVLLDVSKATDYYCRSPHYILDGHDKLRAFLKAGVKPHMVLLTRHQPKEEQGFDADRLTEVLYPWQIEFLLQNWGDKDCYLAAAANNPDSRIMRFVKNGFVQLFHSTGELYSEAFYSSWFTNGNPENEWCIENGQRIGESKMWHRNGWLHRVYTFENGRLHGPETWYHENGRKSLEIIHENGKRRDGTHYSWHPNGSLNQEFTLKDGVVQERKEYSPQGDWIRHEVLDPEKGRLVSRKTPRQAESEERSRKQAQEWERRRSVKRYHDPVQQRNTTSGEVAVGCGMIVLLLLTVIAVALDLIFRH
jgi:antitoxin component YwqK of YwqJK toxin-antitoxin module